MAGMTLRLLKVQAVIPVSPTLSLTPGADSHFWELPQGPLGYRRERESCPAGGLPSWRVPQLSLRGGVFISQCLVLIYPYGLV